MTTSYITASSRRLRVANLMADREWHSTMEINAANVGGSEGCRRLRELRSGGYVFSKRKRTGTSQYEYRLLGKRTPIVASRGQLELL